MADLYETLGVGRDATAEDIKAAHRQKVKRAHPDAGGTREEFDRVQKAFGILSDHSSRRRYDETGAETGGDPRELAHAQAMTTVAGKMNALIGDPKVDPRTYDLVLGIRELIDAERQTLLAGVAESRQMIERLRQFERRLKRKKGKKGADRVTPMIASQITGHGERIAVLEDGIKVMALARELVEEYVYETDPTRQDPYQFVIGSPGRDGWR